MCDSVLQQLNIFVVVAAVVARGAVGVRPKQFHFFFELEVAVQVHLIQHPVQLSFGLDTSVRNFLSCVHHVGQGSIEPVKALFEESFVVFAWHLGVACFLHGSGLL